MFAKLQKLPTYAQILLGAIFLFIAFFLITPEREALNPKHLPWNAYIDADGKLNTLGVVLNKSTLTEAKLVFGNDFESKIFSQKDETGKSLEVYFPSVYIGSIHAAILLKMNITTEEMEATYSRGTGTTINKVGNREVGLSEKDQDLLLPRTFSSITMIPRKNLSEVAIQKRFGEPERIEKQSDGLDHWFFPKMGLELLFDPEGPEALQYTQK